MTTVNKDKCTTESGLGRDLTIKYKIMSRETCFTCLIHLATLSHVK